jgi:hypothetical protein
MRRRYLKEDYNSQSEDCIDLISKIRSDLNDVTEKMEWFETECQSMIDGELDVYDYDLDDYASTIYKALHGFYYQLGQWMSKFRDIDINDY